MQIPLDFELEIDHFEVDYYPGTGKAKEYVSYIRMHDPENGFRDTLRIRVNHPLVYRGWYISQSSFFPGDNTATVLGANKDPGTWLSYTGFATVSLGLVGLFFFRPMLQKRFPSRKQPTDQQINKKPEGEPSTTQTT